MSDQEIDDVAFLTGRESPTGVPHKRNIYEQNGVATCSQKRALIIATAVFTVLLAAAVIIAYAGPQTECSCVGYKNSNYIDEDDNETKPFVPRATNGQVFPWNNIRLPTFVKPIRYNITIHPNLTTLDVKAQISVLFFVEKDTQFIVLHAKNITITDKMVQDKKGNHIRVTKLLEYTGAQQIYFEVKEKFKKKHNYTLNLRYTTKLSRDYKGFYVSSYKNSEGETRYLASTHFQSTFARSAFPCFDEPHLKARFKLSIFRDRFHIALFNTPAVSTEDVGFYMGQGLLRDDFKESVEMSTYLVAFVICDYHNIHLATNTGISVAVYAPSPFISKSNFSLITAVHVMEFFQHFLDVQYPLPKQDLIVVPGFTGRAMESWGLITYSETAILYDPIETSTAAHQGIAVTIAHKVAHQWFGNLVTMKWWNDLWLSEGMASFLEYQGINNFKPEWKILEQFILDKTQPALALDALSSSHPISVTVHDPKEIEAIFDSISYSKGAAIVYMLASSLNYETLQNGLRDYLTTYQYSNADINDLWSTLSRNTNESLEIKTIMDTWTQQMGFPVVYIRREENQFVAIQERFLLTTEQANNSTKTNPFSPYEYKWYLPLTYFTDMEHDKVYSVWMNMTDVRFEINSSVSWIKANVNQTGFYRVMYEMDVWYKIINQLKRNHTLFNAADRAQLIDDVFTLCRAGLLNASVVLDLTSYLVRERDYVPWATAIRHFKTWSQLLSESLAYKVFIQYMLTLLSPIAKYVGWNNRGTHLEKLTRAEILLSAVYYGLNETVTRAKKQFKSWILGNETILADLKEIVYSAGIKFGGQSEWQHCWDVYNTTTIASEKKLLLKALGGASDPWLLQRYLMKTLDPQQIKAQDVKVVLAVVAANPEGRLLAWRHLKAYWPTMHSLFANTTFMMGSLISAVTAHLSTQYDYYEVSTYFNGMDVGSSIRALEQSLETIKLNIRWLLTNEENIYHWLQDHIQ
ncbi:endoplasmic reticulum aminopeptidase 1 isoform X2 [Agrilus planipennis]|uniref:Aminopeptidase n=1 Tax=Agrilus planipennis TaxID=224129 RepID=A0A1W4X2N3_AGRPL|nr:endoplasmic reticulum aminopeptidase 1 isoform X2 [Agrilus planipennis]